MPIKYTRLYTGDDGKSHFEKCSMHLVDSPIGQTTLPMNLSNATFGSIDDVREIDWHNPPCRQYIIMLKGSMEIEVCDGSIRQFHEGELLLAEDLSGQGHITRATSDGSRCYLTLPINNE